MSKKKNQIEKELIYILSALCIILVVAITILALRPPSKVERISTNTIEYKDRDLTNCTFKNIIPPLLPFQLSRNVMILKDDYLEIDCSVYKGPTVMVKLVDGKGGYKYILTWEKFCERLKGGIYDD